MDLKTAILTRRSARSFKEDIPVPDTVIQEMLQMAQAAPSGGNGQSHLFGIIREKSTKKALAENIVCLFLMPVGYPKEEPGPKDIKKISEISFFESYENDSDM